jgi:hypothetical protein
MSLITRLGAVACACGAVPADAAARPTGEPPVARAASATAVTAVRLAPRWGLAFAAWRPNRDQYLDASVNPKAWTLSLNGCGSIVDGKPIGLTNGLSPASVVDPIDGQTAGGQPLGSITVGPNRTPARPAGAACNCARSGAGGSRPPSQTRPAPSPAR